MKIKTAGYEIEGQATELIEFLSLLNTVGQPNSVQGQGDSTTRLNTDEGEFTAYLVPEDALHDDAQKSLDDFNNWAQGMSTRHERNHDKPTYQEGRKIHTCTKCGAPHRRLDHSKGHCLEASCKEATL